MPLFWNYLLSKNKLSVCIKELAEWTQLNLEFLTDFSSLWLSFSPQGRHGICVLLNTTLSTWLTHEVFQSHLWTLPLKMKFSWLDFWSKWPAFPGRHTKNFDLSDRMPELHGTEIEREMSNLDTIKTICTRQVGCVGVYFRLLAPWMVPLTVESHVGIPFFQEEYHKWVEPLMCHHPEERNAAERSLAPENL